jgi:hypothetical protein
MELVLVTGVAEPNAARGWLWTKFISTDGLLEVSGIGERGSSPSSLLSSLLLVVEYTLAVYKEFLSFEHVCLK